MKRYKIATKLFVLTSLALFALLSIQLLFQTLYLEKFYTSSKKMSITRDLEALSSKLKNMKTSSIDKELFLYSQESGTATGVVNLYASPLYGFDRETPYIEVKEEEGEIYKVYVGEFLGSEEFKELLQLGENIRLVGNQIRGEHNDFYPNEITIDKQSFSPMLNIAQKAYPITSMVKVVQQPMRMSISQKAESVMLIENITPVKVVEVEGTITEVYIPGEEIFGNAYKESKLLEQIRLFIADVSTKSKELELGKPIVYENVDTFVGMKDIVGIVPMKLDEELVFLTSMTSLQQVEEAVDIMNKYIFLIFLVAIGIAIMLAYWYATKITKPLVDMRNITTDITNLDFSKQCSLESQDEIGELAQNINMMSTKLKATLEKLQEDMNLKERLDSQRKQFIVDVSHELKTPITVLKATCEGFIEDIYDVKDKVYFYNMLSQVDAMSELVGELLAVARLENESSLKLEVFDLSGSILKMHRQLKYLVAEKGIQIEMNLEESFVQGDRLKIETVIRNIYNNAIFYTAHGGRIKIVIKQEGDRWICSIANSGAKIPEEELEKIWEAFYRIDQSRNKALGGTGLGLYIVKQILNKHNSCYGMENTEQGVRVWFDLLAVAAI